MHEVDSSASPLAHCHSMHLTRCTVDVDEPSRFAGCAAGGTASGSAAAAVGSAAAAVANQAGAEGGVAAGPPAAPLPQAGVPAGAADGAAPPAPRPHHCHCRRCTSGAMHGPLVSAGDRCPADCPPACAATPGGAWGTRCGRRRGRVSHRTAVPAAECPSGGARCGAAGDPLAAGAAGGCPSAAALGPPVVRHPAQGARSPTPIACQIIQSQTIELDVMLGC